MSSRRRLRACGGSAAATSEGSRKRRSCMRLMLTAALAFSVRTFGGRNAQCKSRYMSRTKNRSIARLLEDLSTTVTRWTGESSAFALACTVILVWGVSGPLFHYSDTWQLVINTGTTIVTFLMVFLIQRSQNK